MNQRPHESAAGIALRPPSRVAPSVWALRHLQALLYALGQLTRAPFATLMTTGVIGISLALPAALFLMLENIQQVSRGWDRSAQVSLYLNTAVDAAAAARLADELRARPELEAVRLITPSEALAEFREISDFGPILDAFTDDNPLPAVLVLDPRPSFASPEKVARLAGELERLPAVDIAEFDLQWINRLHAVMAVLERAVLVLAVVLAAGLLLVIANTIRLGIESRREEIEVHKLCGATDAFIRRPFLYGGMWYGSLGGVLAWALVSTAVSILNGPVEQLAALYMSGFRLVTLDAVGSMALLGGGTLLGLIGSWLAVGRHLDAIQPS